VRLESRAPKPPSEPTVSFFTLPATGIQTGRREGCGRYPRAEPSGDLFNRSAKIDVVNAGNEAEYVAVRTAAEAMKELFDIGDSERRCPLAVKRL
jgi:hypothetical protein